MTEHSSITQKATLAMAAYEAACATHRCKLLRFMSNANKTALIEAETTHRLMKATKFQLEDAVAELGQSVTGTRTIAHYDPTHLDNEWSRRGVQVEGTA